MLLNTILFGQLKNNNQQTSGNLFDKSILLCFMYKICDKANKKVYISIYRSIHVLYW